MSPQPEPDNISRQTVTGSLYTVGASLITLVLGFIRMTLMLRLLLPEAYGVYALSFFYVNLVGIIFNFGLDQAFVHHRQMAEKVQRTFFSLRMGSAALNMVVLLLLALIIGRFYPNQPLITTLLLAYIAIVPLREYNRSQVAILSKNLAFRQLSIINVFSSLMMTLIAPLLAWQGWGVWAIVAEDVIGILTRLLLLQTAFQPWKPRFGWDKAEARWFWQYGSQAWSSSNVAYMLNRFDDWFIGTFLGESPLGFYSRAYAYANYPRRIIANPILEVFFPTFAKLQDEPEKLSRAFFRAASLMVRTSALFGLVFVLTAPQFIPLLLTEKWLPMLATFQLMIVYVLLEPLSIAARNLLMAIGEPRFVLRVRLLQLLIFVPLVVGLGNGYGIEGVAIAADLMVLIGTITLFRHTHQLIRYSGRALWLWPLVSTGTTAVLTLLLTPFWNSLPLWASFIGKAAFITLIYLLILWLAERKQLLAGYDMIWRILSPMLKRNHKADEP